VHGYAKAMDLPPERVVRVLNGRSVSASKCFL
jgi:hypothetical protein